MTLEGMKGTGPCLEPSVLFTWISLFSFLLILSIFLPFSFPYIFICHSAPLISSVSQATPTSTP